MRHVPIIDRFWTKVDKQGDVECWIWLAARNGHGYGYISEYQNGIKRQFPAHRVAYELLVGPICDTMQLDHLCRNRACVNPNHLEPVTCRENIHRGNGQAAKNLRKECCKRGHLLRGNNLYAYKRVRHCRTCRRIAALQKYYRDKERQAKSEIGQSNNG